MAGHISIRRDLLVVTALVGTTTSGWLVILIAGWWLVNLGEPANAKRLMSGPSALVTERLRELPQEEWDRELSRLSGSFGYPVIRVPNQEVASLGDIPPELEGDGTLVVVGDELNERLRLARSLGDGTSLVIGPIPDEPPPPLPVVLLMMMVAGLATLAGGFLLTVPLARRMRALETAALKIQEGDLSHRVGEGPEDAIGVFARSFNTMADTVQEHVERQEHLLHAVTHELRTPLSRIRFALEGIENKPHAVPVQNHLADIDADLDEMDELVEELLTYARFDSGSADRDVEAVDLEDVVSHCVAKVDGHRAGIDVEVSSADVRVAADRRYVDRAIGNLIQNAIRHASTRVAIEVGRETVGTEDFGKVVVRDDGPAPPKRRLRLS
ncbi:MAG: histidine kinase dimerization/phospho-acceptor domain-containing protein, partial [Myxococcota bacterium]